MAGLKKVFIKRVKKIHPFLFAWLIGLYLDEGCASSAVEVLMFGIVARHGVDRYLTNK